MQGAFVGNRRPASKKAFREAVQADADNCWLEATSVFGDEYSGTVADAPSGTYSVVGPDPYRDRRWYATVTKRDGKVTVK